MRSSILLILFAIPFLLSAQEIDGNDEKERALGLQLGMRNSYSFFGNLGNAGIGVGGQFRIKPGERWNTEWYFDYIKTDIDGLGHRETMHIGWSVMFYFLEPKERLFKPYLLAGHCFDHARVKPIHPDIPEMVLLTSEEERWSSAVQVGLGTHLMMTDELDLSLTAQYMSHLGNDLSVERKSYGDHDYIRPVQKDEGMSLEGHLLTTLSMNLYIFPR